jgi:plastocyanin
MIDIVLIMRIIKIHFMKKIMNYAAGALAVCAFGIQFIATGYKWTLKNGASDVTVQITKRGYEPKSLNVAQGTTVTWYNAQPGASHSATSDDGLWDTGEMWPGASAYITFDFAPGTYTYHCMIHGKQEAGQIIVEK